MRLKKTCKNFECEQEITNYKSSKRLYCDDSCKNRANYLKRIQEDAELIEMDKSFRNNHRILKKLRKLNFGPISEQTLKSHGFNFDATHKAEGKNDNNGNEILMSHVYDIYFYKSGSEIIIKK
jgi:hypothetical protein